MTDYALFPDLIAYPGASGKMKLAAGWLIEKAGWKGKRLGNVGMHENRRSYWSIMASNRKKN